MAKAPAPKVKMPSAKALPKMPTMKTPSVGNGLSNYLKASKMVPNKITPNKFSA